MANPCYCIMIQLTITLPQKWVYVEPPWLITALDYSGLFSSLLAAVPNKPDQFWFSNASVSVRARMSGFSEGWPWRNLLMPQHPSWLSAGHRHHHGRKRGCGTKPLRFPAGNFIYLFLSEFVAEKHLEYGHHKWSWLVLTSLTHLICCFLVFAGPGGDMQWCFSQVKGAIDDDVAEGMISHTPSKRIESQCLALFEEKKSAVTLLIDFFC